MPEEGTKSAIVGILRAAVADRVVAARSSCAELRSPNSCLVLDFAVPGAVPDMVLGVEEVDAERGPDQVRIFGGVAALGLVPPQLTDHAAYTA